MGIISSKLTRRITPSKGTQESKSNPNEANSSIIPKNVYSSISGRFTVVWLDPQLITSDIIYQNSLARLQRVFISLKTYTNSKDFMKYITSVRNETILLVVANECFKEICSRIKSISQIHSIYILSTDSEKVTFADKDFEKIQGVFNRVEPICNSLKRGVRNFKQDSLVMSIISSIKLTKKDLPQINQLFIYWMLVKQIIIETKYDKQSIKELTKFSRTQYFSNIQQLKIIDEFEKDYHQHSPIWWFTRECFLRNMLSRALQTQDIEIVIRMAFFIKDLYLQIEKLQIETLKTTKLPISAYKSQNISKENFEKMKNIKGNLLAFNNFLIADLDYDNSIDIARSGIGNNQTSIGILFHLKIESNFTSSPFTLLKNISYSPDKDKSILFFMNSIFRIIDLTEIENRLWKIDLLLTQPNDEHITNLSELLRLETQDTTSWFKLAQLMTIIRYYDHARDIYFALLELVPENDVLKMAHIYNQLGVVDDQLGDYPSALQYYQKSIDIRRKHLPPNHRSLGVSYNNMGEVHRQMGDYSMALSTHKKTLDLKQKTLQPNHISFATTYNNIGLASELLGEYNTALEFYQKAIEIKRRALPDDHQELATTYNNIGELQREMGNYTAALQSLEKALKIRLKKNSPTDPSLAIIYNNMGLIHRELGNFSKAIQYLEKSLHVKMKNFPTNHPSFSITYNNIGDIRNQMANFNEALEAYQKALDIQLKSLPPNHPEIATTYNNIGVVYQALANFTEALSYYEKALIIREKAFSPNHPSLATTYNNIGHVHQLKGEYKIAEEYYQKTLKVQQKSLQSNHPSIASTYNNLADIQRKLGNFKKALIIYRRSLDIKKKSLPPYHPSFIITYNNMGVMYQTLKNSTEALQCYKQTLDIQQKILPANHPDLAAIYNNMGVSYQSLKNYQVALDYFEKALKIQNKAFPSDHPDKATTHNSIATVLVNLADYQGALKHEQQAIEIASRTLPPDHPNLLTFTDYYERIRFKVESMEKTE